MKRCWLILGLGVLLIAATGCQALGQLQAVLSALQQKFPDEQCNVNISNGSHITVSLINSKMASAPKKEQQAFMLEVARCACNAWPQPGTLSDVSVAFVSHTQVGPVSYNNSAIGARFTPAELMAAERAPSGTPSGTPSGAPSGAPSGTPSGAPSGGASKPR